MIAGGNASFYSIVIPASALPGCNAPSSNRDTFASSRRTRDSHLLFFIFSASTGESDRSSISNIDRGKAVIPFCDICVVQWYRPFLLNICLGWFRVSVFYFGLANRLSGLPKFESVSALGFLFEFPSSLAHLYNTISRPACQALSINFLQKICIYSRKRLPSPAQMS